MTMIGVSPTLERCVALSMGGGEGGATEQGPE